MEKTALPDGRAVSFLLGSGYRKMNSGRLRCLCHLFSQENPHATGAIELAEAVVGILHPLFRRPIFQDHLAAARPEDTVQVILNFLTVDSLLSAQQRQGGRRMP